MKWAVLILLGMLSLLTGLLLTQVDQFYVEKEQLLQDPVFLTNGWTEEGSNAAIFTAGAVTIENSHAGVSHTVYQTVPIESAGYYQWSYQAATEDVSRGDKHWHRANVTAIHRDHSGRKLTHQAITQLEGTTAMRPYSTIVYFDDDVKSVDMSFRLLHSSGKFTVKEPVISRMETFQLYKLVTYGLSAAWVLVLLVLMVLAVRNLSVALLVPLTVLICVTLVGVLMPEDLINKVSGSLTVLIPDGLRDMSRAFFARLYGVSDLGSGATEVSKLGHIVVFFLIGALVGVFYRRIGLVYGVAAIIVFAFLTESLQLLVYGRSSSWVDASIDAVAAMAGLIPGILMAVMFGNDAVNDESSLQKQSATR